MPKFIFLFLILLSPFQFILAQPNEGTKSGQEILKIIYDTSYVKNAVTIGSDYQDSHVDSALYLAESAYNVAKKIHFLKGQIYSLNLMGVSFIRLGNYSKALETFLEALKICEKTGYFQLTTMVLINIGDLYFKQGEIRAGLAYTFRAKEISEKIKDTLNICGAYINIGNYYESLGYFDSARINTQLGFEFAKKIKNENYMGSTLNNLGNIHSKEMDNTLAMAYYKSAIPYFKKTNDDDGLCESYLGLAKVFSAIEKRDSAVFYAKQTLSIADDKMFTKFIFDASKFISQYYQNNHQIDSAFAYQQIMIAAKDSLFSQEKVKQLQSLTIGESLRQQEIAEEKRREAEERKNNLQYIAIAAFIFLFALSIMLISRRRIKLTTINFLVTVALLLVFEYISLFIHPYISDWTHHSPIYMLLILVIIAAILVPGHHRLEHWIKETLSHKIIHPRTRKMKVKKMGE